jgi:hypothetical protein
MIKPPSPTLGRPRNEVRDPQGKPVPHLGSYERKNRKDKSTKTVYYSKNEVGEHAFFSRIQEVYIGFAE